MVHKVMDREKALLHVSGDEELMDELVEAFLGSTPNQIENIKKAIEEQDIKTFRREAHSIKSASMAIGGERLSETAKETEAATDKGFEPAKQCFQNLLVEFETLKQHLSSC